MALEHRWSSRFDMNGRARIELPGGASSETWMCNISLGGVGIVSRGIGECGMRVQVSLHFGDHGGLSQSCRLQGEIVHDTTGRLGIAFLDAGPEAIRTLREALGNPERRRAPRDESASLATEAK